jgi:hypothetical protein
MEFETGELTVDVQEIRSQGPDRPVAVTASWSAQALETVAAVMSDQLARLRLTPAEDAGQVLLLRQYATLGDRLLAVRLVHARLSEMISEARAAARGSQQCSVLC